MKAGRTLEELASEIQRQTASKRDFVATSSAMRLSTRALNRVEFTLSAPKGDTSFLIGTTAHEQIATRLEIPHRYYDRMLASAPSLLAQNVNHWFTTNEDRRFLVRALDGRVRALLSDRYRPLDNFDLATTVLTRLQKTETRVESCELTEKRLYIKAVTPRITADIKVGDTVQAGLIVTNSEIGLGAVKIEPMIFRLICANGAIVNTLAMRRHHVGRRALEFTDADQYYRDETRLADDRAFWMKVGDMVDAMADATMFASIVSRWQEAATQKITKDPVEVVEVTAKKFGLYEDERANVLTHLIQGHDLSAYGLMNAVTRAAQDAESYDRGTDLERIGPAILELPRQQWRELAEK